MSQVRSSRTGVYQILCTVSGKSYVGSSVHIERRWREHRRHLRNKDHPSPRLQQAWNKHGEELFVFSVLEECAREDLFTREQFHIGTGKRDYSSMPIVRVFTPEMRAKAIARLRARAAAITHCPNGHEYTPENTSFQNTKWKTRLCKACARDRTRAALAVETPEQAAGRLRKGLAYHNQNRAERLTQQRAYTERTRDAKRAYDKAHLAEKRVRRAAAKVAGRVYG